jgi:ATP-dependent DNA helicase RecG
MNTTPQQIDSWRRSNSEHQNFEFKEAKNRFDSEKLYKYCVAIANEGGGFLLLGIADAPPRPVVGTLAFDDPVAMAKKLFDAVNFRVEIEEVAHPDGRVLVFHIPSRPSGTAYQLKGAFWMRLGESLVPMSSDRLRTIHNEGKPDWGEHVALEGLSAQEVVELLDIQTFFELRGVPFPTERIRTIDYLIRERLVDKIDGRYTVCRLAALLLARRLTDFPIEISRKSPRVVTYLGPSKLKTKFEKLGTKGYAIGFQGLVRYVIEQLPQNEVIKDALRTEVKTGPGYRDPRTSCQRSDPPRPCHERRVHDG